MTSKTTNGVVDPNEWTLTLPSQQELVNESSQASRTAVKRQRVLSKGEERVSAEGDKQLLVVEYPRPTDDPASRDVWIDVEQRDWSGARAIEFQARSEHPTRLSVSFLDGNRVAYTHWSDLVGTGWHTVRVVFDSIKPNPYVQPPDANKDVTLDVSSMSSVGLAPRDSTTGTLWIRKLLLVR